MFLISTNLFLRLSSCALWVSKLILNNSLYNRIEAFFSGYAVNPTFERRIWESSWETRHPVFEPTISGPLCRSANRSWQVTHFTEQSLSEANSRSASQLIFRCYGTRRFIPAFTRARHRSQFWARWIQYTPPNRISVWCTYNTAPRSSEWSAPLRLLNQNAFLIFPMRAACATNLILLDMVILIITYGNWWVIDNTLWGPSLWGSVASLIADC